MPLNHLQQSSLYMGKRRLSILFSEIYTPAPKCGFFNVFPHFFMLLL